MKQCEEVTSPGESDVEPEPREMPSELQLLFFLLKVL